MKAFSKNDPLSIQRIEGVHDFLNGQLVKYTLTSLAATACDFLIFYICLEIGYFSPLAALWIGQLVGSIIAFILQYRWVFRFIEGQSFVSATTKFFGGQIAAAAANALFVWLLMEFMGIDAWIYRLFTSVGLWAILYLFNKFWVFRQSDRH